MATFAWNTARHLELYFGIPCTGRVLHTLNIRLFPEQLVVHRQPRRGRGDLRRPVAASALLWPLVDQFETVRHIVVMDDGKGEVPEPRRRPGRSTTTRTCWPPPTPVDVRRRRREPRRGDGLHERHHRQPEGRRLLPPLDLPAHARLPWRPASLGVQESDRILPVVPMFHANAWGLAHAAVAAGASLVMPGPDLSAPAHRQAHRGGAGHDRGRRAHDLDGRAARAEGPRHLGAAGHPVRRLGGAAGAVARATASRPACRSCRPGA